jgi:processive 1,2-diacylglycerol beta-glucosyltransferase
VKKPPRVLLVYGYEPSGHSAAAFSLGEALRAAGAVVSYVEVAGRHHPKAGQAVAKGYHALVRSLPGVFGRLYRSPTAHAALRAIRGAYLGLGGASKLLEGVRRERPDLIVCPQASVSAVFAGARARGTLDIPVAGVVTDFTVHPFWLDPAPDFLVVADESLRPAGVPSAACGIPVASVFARPPSRTAARESLALPPSAPVALLSGGSKGLGRLRKAAEELLAEPRTIVLALCGTNAAAFRSLSRSGPRLRAFGPQPPAMVAAMLAAADVHVTKPGGVSCAESLAVGTPLRLMPGLPGQEQANAAFLECHAPADIARPQAARDAAAILCGLAQNFDETLFHLRQRR